MPAHAREGHAPIGILSAIPQERELLRDSLEDGRDVDDATLSAGVGTLDGFDVVLAEAGIGKVEAAASATLLLERFGCRALVFSGVAGGLGASLDIGDLVVADRVIDVDYGRATDAGEIVYQPGRQPLPQFEPQPGYELPAASRQAIHERLRTAGSEATLGTILTGDMFLASARIRDELAERWSAVAIEMEGSAVCGVAERFDVPWLIVRALSDRAGEDSVTDFQAFVTSAAAAAAGLVRTLLPVVAPLSNERPRKT